MRTTLARKNILGKIRVGLGKAAPFLLVAIIAFAFGAKADQIDWSFKGNHNINKDLPEDLDYSSVEKLYDSLRGKYDGKLEQQQLLDGLKKGLIEATGDPYTVYLNAKESQEFKDSLEGRFSGIGAELGRRDDQLVIISPIDGFPAQKAGLRAGDVILTVDDQEAVKWSVEQAVTKIRGQKGTTVKLKIARGSETKDYSIVRDEITVPSVKSEIIGDTGYIQITRFADDTGTLARRAADELKQKGAKGIVLDLRGNGGGYLQAAVDVSGLWLEDQVVVEERTGGKVTDSLRSGHDAPLKGIKTSVLIDGGSASASEIVAGALQDHKAATLIGDKSFGKGSVQEIQELKDGGELKVTIARWYTPNGKNIDKEGIKPDIEVKATEEDAKASRDPQKDRALEFIRNGQ